MKEPSLCTEEREKEVVHAAVPAAAESETAFPGRKLLTAGSFPENISFVTAASGLPALETGRCRVAPVCFKMKERGEKKKEKVKQKQTTTMKTLYQLHIIFSHPGILKTGKLRQTGKAWGCGRRTLQWLAVQTASPRRPLGRCEPGSKHIHSRHSEVTGFRIGSCSPVHPYLNTAPHFPSRGFSCVHRAEASALGA